VPAEPPTLTSAVPNLELGRHDPAWRRTLVVLDVRDVDGDEPPVLIVGDAAE
jgi:hypothetical protein